MRSIGEVLRNEKTRRGAFALWVLTMMWMLELGYSIWSNNLGLLMYSMLTVFRCLTIFISLVTIKMEGAKRTLSFSYGHGRFEPMLGFASCILVFFAISYVAMDAIFELLLEGSHGKSDLGVIPVTIFGMFANISGAIFFRQFLNLRAENIHGEMKKVDFVMQYLMHDLLCCSAVVLGAWISSWRSAYLAEPIVAIFCGFFVFKAVLPFAFAYGRVLLQATPQGIKTELDTRLREAATLPGVLEIRDEHFWTQSPGVFVGCLRVRVSLEADVQMVLAKVHRLFAPLVTHLTIQTERDDWGAIPVVTHTPHTHDTHEKHSDNESTGLVKSAAKSLAKER